MFAIIAYKQGRLKVHEEFNFISSCSCNQFWSGNINSIMENWRSTAQLLNNLFLTGIFNLWDIKIGRVRTPASFELSASSVLKFEFYYQYRFAAYGNNIEDKFLADIKGFIRFLNHAKYGNVKSDWWNDYRINWFKSLRAEQRNSWLILCICFIRIFFLLM